MTHSAGSNSSNSATDSDQATSSGFPTLAEGDIFE
ncbi:unnamed protein product [Spirodela intermedia]|uniref:Uncharacterized protein n=2 Tax=Spirodela intermedia TaxID=51605 RepID=A0A7I8LFD0_SPIIN|nr:unnamed protein product [Spirodela intermedia]CAA6670900.1 unnamed protein product [Spirodela intermedia]CAA7407995.1 unnamed protein product [Spirodela intermedia]